MKLTSEEAKNIVNKETDDWEEIECNICDSGRWSIAYEAIYLHKPSNKYYRFYYNRGATEIQDESPYEYDKEVTVQEVIKKQKIVKVWEDVKES